MGNKKMGDRSMNKSIKKISRPAMVTLAILMAILMVFVIAGSAHTYIPTQKNDIEWDSAEDTNLEWGDIEEIETEDWNQQYSTNISYELFVVDFNPISTSSVPSSYSTTYPDVDTILSKLTSTNINVIKNHDGTIIPVIETPFPTLGTVTFPPNSTNMPKADKWLNGIYNYNNDLLLMVEEVEFDLSSDEEDAIKMAEDNGIVWMPTDPQGRSAKVSYAVRGLPQFEGYYSGYYGDETTDDREIFKSNNRYLAVIEIENNGDARAYHVNVNVSIEPTQTIAGKYPPSCQIVEIYAQKNSTSNSYNRINTKMPLNLRSVTNNDTLEKGTSISYKIYFKTPSIAKETKYNITAQITSQDVKEHVSIINYTKELTILPVLEVTKSIGTGDYSVTGDETPDDPTKGEVTTTVYADYKPYTYLVVKNVGNYTIRNVTLRNNLTAEWNSIRNTNISAWQKQLPSFLWMKPSLINDTMLEWTFDLKPGEKIVTAYPVTLLKPGNFEQGKAYASWVQRGVKYEVESYPHGVEVHGPYIEVTKSVSSSAVEFNSTLNLSSTVDVTVNVKNSGDRQATVLIQDTLPEGATLTNKNIPNIQTQRKSKIKMFDLNETTGTVLIKKIMDAGDTFSFTYTIQLTKEEFLTLPPSFVEFTDLTLYRGIRISEPPTINVGNPVVEDTATSSQGTGQPSATDDEPAAPLPTREEEVTPGFGIVFAILAITLFASTMRKKHI